MSDLFDIACNFSSDRFDKDLYEVIERAKNNKVTKFLVVSATLKDTQKVYNIYKQNSDSCFFTIGVHPHHANEFNSTSSMKMMQQINEFKRNIRNEIGIGTIRFNHDSIFVISKFSCL